MIGDAWPSAIDDGLQRLVTIEPVGEHNAAFAPGHQLAFLKTETSSVSSRAGAAPLELATMGVGTVFDNHQLMLAGDGEQCVHVGKTHGHVHRHQRASARSDRCTDGFGIDAIRIGVHIDEHRHATGLENGDGGAIPRVSGHDDFITKLEAKSQHGGIERNGAVGEAESIFRAVQFRKARGEVPGMFARHREPAPVAALNDSYDAVNVRLLILGPGCERFFADWFSA